MTIPCISIKGQKIFHSGYELRDKDKHVMMDNLMLFVYCEDYY